MGKSWNDKLQQVMERAGLKGVGIPFMFLGRCSHCGKDLDKKGKHKVLNHMSIYETQEALLDDEICRDIIGSYNETLKSMPAAMALIRQLDLISVKGGH